MSTKYKKLKNNALTKAKQTRTEQVNAKAKKYNKKISKSDEAYINGNIRQASAMRAYGIKQARAKGEEVYGYSKDNVYKARKNQLTVGKEINKDKAKYLYTNKKTTVPGGTRKDGSTYDSFTSRKRMLTDDEKTSLSKYGDLYDKNKESKQYKWMDSSKKDAKNLLEHMNTFRMDGIKTAKARAREEKGLGKLKEYGTGLAKDILIDPLVDTLRVADTVGGSLTGAGLGALENLDNLMKGYELDKDLISNNFKSSIKSSNETGWSKSSSEVLREREERQFLKDKEYYNNDEIMKKMYGTSDLEQHKKNIEKGTKYAGFIWDIIGDPTDIVNVAGKNLLKNTAKSGKELLTGTADISTAFKSKHLDDIFFSSKPYEDLKIFDDSGAGKIHSQLDNAYDRSVANDVREKVVQKVSTSSQKPFLASFLDELNNNSPLEGKQLKIDGRTLNKKYTQLKNPVEPYKVPELNPTIKDAKVDKGYQLSMFDTVEGNFGKDISANKIAQDMTPNYNNYNKSIFATENFNSDYVRKPDPALKTGRYKYENGAKGNIKYDNELYDKVKEYERMIDESDDKVADLIYDYLEENEPEVYARLMDGSDMVDEIVGAGVKKTLINDNYTKQFQEIEKKAKKERKFDAKKNEELEVENAVEQLLNIFDKKKTKVKNSKIRKFEFSHNIKDLSDKIVKGEFTNDDISQITKKLKSDSITKEVKRQQVNNLLFGGKEVLTKNVTSKNIDELLTSIEEIVSMKNAKDWYNETGEITKFKLSASTRKMLDIPNNKKVTVEDLDIDKLVQLLNNKSRSYTDNRYYEKLELLARVHEYDKIENVRNRVKEIDKEFKILDKKPLSQEVIKAKTDLSKERKLLKKKIDDRDKHWKQIRDLTENDFDKYISENYNQHMKGMNPYKHNTSKYKEIKNMDNLYGYKEALDETSSIRRNQKLTYDDIRDEVLHEIKNYSEHKGVNYSKKDINDLVNTRWEDYKNSLSDMKKSEDIQNRNATNVYNPKKGMDDLSQSPRLEQENLESVGEFDFKLSNQIKSLRKQLNLPNITPPKAKIKLTKGQKLHEIPPAKDSLKGLRSVIEKELDFMNKKPNEYAGMEQAFKEIKKSYVNTLRQIGIRDEQYFHKVKALQDDLKLYYQTLKEPKKVRSDSPLVKMNLQALARRISETFDELDNVVIDNINEMATTVDNRNQKLSKESIEMLGNTIKYAPNDELKQTYKNIFEMDVNEVKSKANELQAVIENMEKNNIEVPPEFRDILWFADVNLRSKGTRRLYMPKASWNLSVEDLRNAKTPFSQIPDNKRVVRVPSVKETNNLSAIQKQNTPIEKIKSPIEKADDYINDFEKFNVEENLREIEQLKNSNKGVKQIGRMQKPTIDEIDEILKEYSDVNTPKFNLAEDMKIDFDKYDEDGVLKGSFKPNTPLEKISKESYHKPTWKEIYAKQGRLDEFYEAEKSNRELYNRLNNPDNNNSIITDNTPKIFKETKEKNNFFKKMFQENNGEKLGYEDNEIYNAYKRWLNSYKKGHTIYNPGWHVQNYFQNKGQNYLALGVDAFAPQTKAKNLLHEIKGKSNKAQDTYGKYSKNEIIDFIKQNGVVDGLGEDVISSNGIFPKLETSIDNSDFMKKLGESEQTARLHHFLTQLERGKSMEESLKSVNDTLFDYSKKTNLDKVISDFVDPFWVFHKNNAKLIGKSAIKNSDKFSRLDRGLRNLGEPGEDGKRGTGYKFVDDVNKDEYEYRYKQQILPDARESLSISDGDIENKLNPLLQLAIKHSKGEGNFGNKIVDGEANWGEITKDEAIKEALLDVNPFMPQLVKFINNATDKKDRAESGKQSEETSNKQILHDFITFITGNKGNYYRQY